MYPEIEQLDRTQKGEIARFILLYCESCAYSLAVKVSFTLLFGVYVALMFYRSGSLLVAIALHAQCNYFQFIDLTLPVVFSTRQPMLNRFCKRGLLSGRRRLHGGNCAIFSEF